MRRLALLVAMLAVSATLARAVPQPDAEQAYARGDYATAFKLWLPLAEQGSARAQTNVARMYERGEWVAQDPAMAAEWYRRAAEQGAPVQTGYTPLATPAPAPASYPLLAPYRPAPSHHHHHHHGGHRH